MATKTATAPSADAPAKKFVEKPEKPDEDKFKVERDVIEKELQDIRDKLVSWGRFTDSLRKITPCGYL